MIDVVGVYDQFRSRYPVFQQVPIASKLVVQAVPRTGKEEVESSALPRVMMSTEDLEFSCLLQTDRFSVSWSRQLPLNEPCSYPGFAAMLQSLEAELSSVVQWFATHNYPDLSPDVIELAYKNAFLIDVDGASRSVNDIFTFFKNPRGIGMSAFSTTWIEPLREDSQAPEDLSGTITVTSGSGIGPDGDRVLLFNLTGLRNARSRSWNHLAASYSSLHDKMLDVFAGSIVPPARETVQ